MNEIIIETRSSRIEINAKSYKDAINYILQPTRVNDRISLSSLLVKKLDTKTATPFINKGEAKNNLQSKSRIGENK